MSPGYLVRASRQALRLIAQQRRVPPHIRELARLQLQLTWTATVRRIRHWLRGPRYIAATLRARRTVAASVMIVDGTWQSVVPFRFTSVREVTEDNVAAVAALLSARRVPFFVRDASCAGEIVLGVDEIHRDGALRALADAATSSQLYARRLGGRTPVPLHAIKRSLTARAADRLVIYRNHRLARGFVVGASHGCVVEMWHQVGKNLRPPKGAPLARVIRDEAAPADLVIGGRVYPTLSTFAEHRALDDVPFPIDVVYTWVDDADPEWQQRLAETRQRFGGKPLHEQAANPSRYRNRDELRYSLRSLALYAPFVRRIFIVTAGHVPEWLADHPAITVVDHSEILPEECLPTFNSHAIESRLHHIEGLAEHYLYLNDDFLFGRDVEVGTYFAPSGVTKVLPDQNAPIPHGPATADDRPVDSASKNVRDLLRTELGARIGRKILHVPYPQRRSVLHEMEERFSEAFARTAASTFRQPTDINVASCFFHYYAFVTGRAVEGAIASSYVDISRKPSPLHLRQLIERRDRDVVCINDADVPPERAEELDAVVADFLEGFLPVPSPFENPASVVSGVDAKERDHVGEGIHSG